jgi:RHS repeat-associated protein
VTNPGGSSTSAIDPSGARLATSSGGTTAFTLGDLHGNIAGQVNSAITTVLSALRYDPYGLEAPGGGSYDSGGSFANPWRYQGRLDVSPDAANPLYDMSARFYSPGLGTFTQHDTVQGSAIDPRSLNRFLYAAANPTSMSDPTGHISNADYYDDEQWATTNGQLITNPDGTLADVYYKSYEVGTDSSGSMNAGSAIVTGEPAESDSTLKYALQMGSPYSTPMYPLDPAPFDPCAYDRHFCDVGYSPYAHTPIAPDCGFLGLGCFDPGAAAAALGRGWAEVTDDAATRMLEDIALFGGGSQTSNKYRVEKLGFRADKLRLFGRAAFLVGTAIQIGFAVAEEWDIGMAKGRDPLESLIRGAGRATFEVAVSVTVGFVGGVAGGAAGGAVGGVFGAGAGAVPGAAVGGALGAGAGSFYGSYLGDALFESWFGR